MCTCNSASYRNAPHLSCTPHLCPWYMERVSLVSFCFPPSTVVVLAVVLSFFLYAVHKLQYMTAEDIRIAFLSSNYS